MLPFIGLPSMAQDSLSPRLQIGIGILPAVIAANKRLSSEDGQTLQVYLVYRNNHHLAEQLKPALAKIDRVRKRRLQVESISLTELLQTEPAASSAIFIAEPMGNNLDDLIEFVQQKQVLLFSPFEGDVERGVTAGFRVTDKVLPMVNMASLKLSNIYLKAFFLRVAVKHE